MKNRFVLGAQKRNRSHVQANAPKTWQLLPTESCHQNQVGTTGNKTKKGTGNEAAKGNRTDFAKVSAI